MENATVEKKEDTREGQYDYYFYTNLREAEYAMDAAAAERTELMEKWMKAVANDVTADILDAVANTLGSISEEMEKAVADAMPEAAYGVRALVRNAMQAVQYAERKLNKR